MEIGEVIEIGSVVAILLAVVGMGLVLIQRIDSGYDKLAARIDRFESRLGARLDAVGTRISEVECE